MWAKSAYAFLEVKISLNLLLSNDLSKTLCRLFSVCWILPMLSKIAIVAALPSATSLEVAAAVRLNE